VEVKHIVEAGKLQPHRLTPGAVITADARVIYPPQQPEQMRIEGFLNIDTSVD
jgi:hypothetical protein